MKKKTIVVIIALMMLFPFKVKACSCEDGCTNCGASAATQACSSSCNSQEHPVNITGLEEDKIPKKTTCKTLFGGKTGEIIKDLYKLIKFIVPILLIAMSIKDFGGVIINQDNDGIKKATTTFLKRLVIAITILIIPTVIGYILKLFGIDGCLI